jgi:hypothetical protein
MWRMARRPDSLDRQIGRLDWPFSRMSFDVSISGRKTHGFCHVEWARLLKSCLAVRPTRRLAAGGTGITDAAGESMSITRLFTKVFALFVVVGFAVPAMAQDAPKVEVSGGYNYLHVPDESVPAGWYLDATGNITPTFGIVGQLTGNYKSFDDDAIDPFDSKLHTFMGGVRVNARAVSGVTPFAQVLLGAARASASSDLLGDLGSSTDAALQLGGGVKFMPGTIGLQVGADYLRIFTEDEGTNAFRFAAGIVVGF